MCLIFGKEIIENYHRGSKHQINRSWVWGLVVSSVVRR